MPIFLQVSFAVPAEVIPGRLSLLLTLLLCMNNTLNSVARNTPKSGGNTTAIVKWMLSCLLFIVLALLEYAAILLLRKYHSNSHPKNKTESKEKSQSKPIQDVSKTVDKIMLIFSPPVFCLFSIIFWTTYYLLNRKK